jgi:hypothetical protein
MWWPVLELARKRTWSASVITTLGTDRECYKRVIVCGILVIVAEVVCGGFAREREREREDEETKPSVLELLEERHVNNSSQNPTPPPMTRTE